MMHPDTKKFFTYCAFIAAFFIILVGPIFAGRAGVDFESMEKRPLAPPPTLWDDGPNPEFFQEFDDYYSDHFGLRNFMSRIYSNIALISGHSTNDQVITMGMVGALFYAETLPDYMRIREVDVGGLSDALDRLDELCTLCVEKNMRFCVVIAPNKNSVDTFARRMPFKPGKGLRAMDVIRNAWHFWLVDAEKILDENGWGKYYFNDTHWTLGGADTIYTYTMESIELPYQEYEFTIDKPHQGDLKSMLNMKDHETESAPEMWEKYTIEEGESKALVTSANRDGKGRLYLFADSFGENIFPYFANDFERVVYDRAMPYDFQKAVDDGSDTIIIVMAERNIQDFLLQTDWDAQIEIIKNKR